MGVSISMIPGPLGRPKGKEINITPGWRSRAAEVLRQYWSESPIVLTRDDDEDQLRAMADAASIHVFDKENFWKQIADAVDEYGTVTILLEW